MEQIERQKLGDWLHDEVLQYYATCQMKIQLCRKLMDAGRYEEAGKELARIEAAVETAIDGTRRVITSLRNPPVPGDGR